MSTISRREARRAAVFMLFQWDVTGRPLGSLYEGEVDAYTLRLGVAYGRVLPEVSAAVQERVADALVRMCAVEVDAVDVTVEELDRA